MKQLRVAQLQLPGLQEEPQYFCLPCGDVLPGRPRLTLIPTELNEIKLHRVDGKL